MDADGEQDIDLEEAVGSYLNCLSTSCAAGGKLYTSVCKIIHDKLNLIFPHQSHKTCHQTLQIQNEFEGYQRALLDCKDKLLEILIESHTNKKQHPSTKDGRNRQGNSVEEQYVAEAFRVAKELYCYHQTVAQRLQPLLFSEHHEDFDNATFSSNEDKEQIIQTWSMVVEANKVLRSGYGLTNVEIGQILSWQHGAELSESCRKRLNHRVNQLLQQYVDLLYTSATCEDMTIPLVFSRYPEHVQRMLQDCCSPSEGLAASGQGIPVVKEEIEVMLHRELPRLTLCLNGRFYDKASPGKAFENTTLKMRAIREKIVDVCECKKIGASKEQIDLLCLRVLATSSITISYACSRTAVIMAFGKSNLIQVRPPFDDESDKVVYFNISKDVIEVNIQSKWCITEDSSFLAFLERQNTLRPIATVDVSYHVLINIEDYLVKRLEPTPIAHISQCVLRQSPSTSGAKKDVARERSKSIKIRLTKATNKLFHRKLVVKSGEEDPEGRINDSIKGERGADNKVVPTTVVSGGNSSCDSDGDAQPIPPPRLKRKAKKSKKPRDSEEDEDDLLNQQLQEQEDLERAREKEAESCSSKEKERKEKAQEKKEDLGWFLSSPKFGIPPVAAVSGSKDCSPSVASFEELQGVIDFLSGSSSSSLAVNEKGEKILARAPFQRTHKRNNSTTSLQSESTKHSDKTPEGKLKLCHKKSASFSGDTKDMKTKEGENNDPRVEDVTKLLSDINNLPSSVDADNVETDNSASEQSQGMDLSSESDGGSASKTDDSTSDSVSIIKNVERTPGDGMDNKVDDKNAFNSTININSTIGIATKSNDKTVDSVGNQVSSKSDDAAVLTPLAATASDAAITKEITSLASSLGQITLVNSVEVITKTDVIHNSVLAINELDAFKVDSTDAKKVVEPIGIPLSDVCGKVSPKLPPSSDGKNSTTDVKSEPKGSAPSLSLPDPASFYPGSLSPGKTCKADYEIELINSFSNNMHNRNGLSAIGQGESLDRSLMYRNSVDSVRCLQDRLLVESERNLPNRLLMESERHHQLHNRYSADIERTLHNRILMEKNMHRLPNDGGQRQFMSRTPLEQDTGAQHLLKTDCDRGLQSRLSLDADRNLSSRLSMDSERTDSKIPSPVSEIDTQSEDGGNRDLNRYEPFNSKWSVALSSKPTSWSDATFDSESLSPKPEVLSSAKQGETDFTLDKQLDFNKLLEGSKFFQGQRASGADSWRDRSSLPGGGISGSFDYPRDAFIPPPQPHQHSLSSDPWPLHSLNHPRNQSSTPLPFSDHSRSQSSTPLPFSANSHHHSHKRSNNSSNSAIESLQLPPNPAGPYMRQNREQLLAKQQILEQYARHQKQLQIQQQHHQLPSKQMPNPQLPQHGLRMPNSMPPGAERAMSLPPGFDRRTNSPHRYDLLSDRSPFRTSNPAQHRNHGNNQFVFNNNQFSSAHAQSRSVNDIRMENSGVMSERLSFSQMSEQNLVEQYNQLTDGFSQRY